MTTSNTSPSVSEAPETTVSRLRGAAQNASRYLAAGKAPNTQRAYGADWRHFAEWCRLHGLSPLPAEPETVALYVADIAQEYRVSTVERRVAAIAHEHNRNGAESPTGHAGVREVLKGIRRVHGTAREGKAALAVEALRAMVTPLARDGATLTEKRDRALLLVGFAGALRRSELVALTYLDVANVDEGIVLSVSRSKTDQTAEGREVGIARGEHVETCPVRALATWLDASGIRRGPLFRAIDRHGHMREKALSGYSVDLIVKARLRAAGIPKPETYAAHSLRSGHATAAAKGGAAERSIMRQGRWNSERTLRGYVRHGSLFAENSSAALGL